MSYDQVLATRNRWVNAGLKIMFHLKCVFVTEDVTHKH